MPPKGGYAPFEYAKQYKPRWIKGKWVFLGFAVYTTIGLQLQKRYYYNYVTLPELENREANIALEPLLLAENNRLFLKQLVKNREDEKKIMKDVPGWVPGTFYGEPVFHQKGVYMKPSREEYYAHTDYDKGYYRHLMERHYH